MEIRRPVITAHQVQEETTYPEREISAPSNPPGTVVDPDETAGLVNVLYHAQQTVIACADSVVRALDANDEEVAKFMEEAQRESVTRVSKAKVLLAARLQAEVLDRHGPHPIAAGHQLQNAEQPAEVSRPNAPVEGQS